MKKNLRFFMLIVAALFCMVPKALAVITDPEDHVFYYSDKIGSSREFDIPDFMKGTGWKYGSTGVVLNSNRRLYEFLEVEPTDTVYALIMDKKTGKMELHLPYCDSIFVEFWGTGQRGIKISNNKNDLYGWHAEEGNRPVSTGVRFREKDSVTVYLTPTKLDMNVKPTGDVFINSIKIYGPMGDNEVPEFDGSIAAWTFQYRPQASGTVDLNDSLQESDGWQSELYPMYASDLGVVRAKLTTSASGMCIGYDDIFNAYAAKIEDLGITQAGDYTDGNKHSNYFQMEVSARHFQDLSLNFDFTLLDGGDTCVVAYLLEGSTKWQVAGKFLKNEDAWNCLTSVQLPLPELTNQSNITFRIMMGNGDYSSGGGMVLSHLALKGYDDYYESNADAVSVAYITNATDRVHILDRALTADSLDTKLLPALLEDPAYRVSIITQDAWKDLTSENIVEAFAGYDLVILSEFPDAQSSIVKACKALVGQKPFLNFKAEAYRNDVWDWANMAICQEDTFAAYERSFRFHPIFSEARDTEKDYSVALFGKSTNGETLQGFDASSYKGPQPSYMIASPLHTPSAICFHEWNASPEAKYMLLGFSGESYAHLEEASIKMIKHAMEYLLSEDLFVAPQFNMTATGAEVENLSELKAALAYDYSALRLDEIQILLKDCQDESGMYQLGDSGMEMSSLGHLIIKASEGAEPVLSGSFFATNTLCLESLTMENLRFAGDPTCTKALLPIQAGDVVNEKITLKSCSFLSLTQTIFESLSADSASIGGLCIEQSYVENFGGTAQEGPAFISLGSGHYWIGALDLTETVFRNYHGKQLLQVQMTTPMAKQEESIRFSIDHNTFYAYSGTAEEDAALLEWKTNPQAAVTVDLCDNLFYGSYAQGGLYNQLALFEASKPAELNLLNNYSDMPLKVVSGNFKTTCLELTADSLGISKVFVNDSLMQISKISPLYAAGTNRTQVGARACYIDRTEKALLRVKNVPELITALEISVAGDEIVLENCDDESGVYLLGRTGLVYPTHFGDLSIYAAEGHAPQLFGRLSSSNGCKLSNLTIKGLNFVGRSGFTGNDQEVYAPFYINVRDSIMDTLLFEDCSFTDLENQQIFRTNTGCAGMHIGRLVYEHCLFDNMGGNKPIDGKSYGAHFIQFQNSLSYSLDHFIFRNNTVKNFHGSQLFNISRQNSTSKDSLMEIIIDNNLFYYLGGHADKNRNFLEFNKQPAGFDVTVSISDNIFYQRLSSDYYPIAYLSLFDKDSAQQVEVDVLNNFFDGEYYSTDETYGDNPVAPKDDSFNLKAIGAGESQSTNIQPRYTEPMTRASLGINDVFEQWEPVLLIGQSSPLFRAGRNGSFVGPWDCYYTDRPAAMDKAFSETSRMQAYSKDGVLYLQSTQDQELTVFDLLGRVQRVLSVKEGLNVVDGLSEGIYLLKSEKELVKVLVR